MMMESSSSSSKRGSGRGKRFIIIAVLLCCSLVTLLLHKHLAEINGCHQTSCMHPALMELLIPGLVTAGMTQPTAGKDTCHMLASSAKNASGGGGGGGGDGDLPTAFLVSCMRCGSTWQYQYAEAHPCMRGARPPHALLAHDGFCWRNDCQKEVSFFDRKERYARGVDYYSQYYPRTMCSNSKPCLRVDGTPGYLSSWQAPMRLNRTYSMIGMKHAVKVVIQLRNPVGASISRIKHDLRMRGGSMEEMVHEMLKPQIDAVEDCLVSNGAARGQRDSEGALAAYRACHPIGGGLLKEKSQSTSRAAVTRILMDGLYVAQVRSWERAFTPAAVLVTTLEAATARPGEVLGAVMDHLGMPHFTERDAKRIATQGDGLVRRAAMAVQLALMPEKSPADAASLLASAEDAFAWFYQRESAALTDIISRSPAGGSALSSSMWPVLLNSAGSQANTDTPAALLLTE